MKDIRDEIINDLLEQIKELKKLQTISKENMYLFTELYFKLGGREKLNEIKKSCKYKYIILNDFADMFLILVNEYIEENNKGEE